MANLNKLRQVNPHWKPSKSFIEAQEEAKQMAEGIKELVDKQEKMDPSKYDGDVNKVGLSEASKYYNKTMNPSKYTKDELEQAKDLIVNKITKHFNDVMFEMVCEEMGDNYLFQSSNYLTEAGYDMFEDEWFEFYHEHHGDILYQVMQNITN